MKTSWKAEAQALAKELVQAKAEINRLVHTEHIVQRFEALGIMSDMITQQQTDLNAARAEIAALKGFQASTPKSVDFIVFFDGDGAEPEVKE
jgi:hypothetical protein